MGDTQSTRLLAVVTKNAKVEHPTCMIAQLQSDFEKKPLTLINGDSYDFKENI